MNEEQHVAVEIAKLILSQLDSTGVLLVALGLVYVAYRIHHNGKEAKRVGEVVAEMNNSVNNRPKGEPSIYKLVSDLSKEFYEFRTEVAEGFSALKIQMRRLERDQEAIEETLEEQSRRG